jgi:hypothetical protein
VGQIVLALVLASMGPGKASTSAGAGRTPDGRLWTRICRRYEQMKEMRELDPSLDMLMN